MDSVNNHIHKSRAKTKYDNGWGGYQVERVSPSTCIIILFQKNKTFLPTDYHNLFSNLHENKTKLMLLRLELCPRITSPYALPSYKFILMFSLFSYLLHTLLWGVWPHGLIWIWSSASERRTTYGSSRKQASIYFFVVHNIMLHYIMSEACRDNVYFVWGLKYFALKGFSCEALKFVRSRPKGRNGIFWVDNKFLSTTRGFEMKRYALKTRH